MSIRKGWCPSLTKPMETGDGLLVRLHMNDAKLSVVAARGIAQAAERFGNGLIDLTSRGNIQIRGVTPQGYDALLDALAIIDVHEEPRPEKALVAESVTLGWHENALYLSLAYGRMDKTQLIWLADIAESMGDSFIGLTTQRVVILKNIMANQSLLLKAQALGFITHDQDARLYIQACPGAPACSSAFGDTRALADAVAALSLHGKTIHVSGCDKGCACSKETDVVVTVTPTGYGLNYHAKASSAPQYSSLSTNAVIEMLKS